MKHFIIFVAAICFMAGMLFGGWLAAISTNDHISSLSPGTDLTLSSEGYVVKVGGKVFITHDASKVVKISREYSDINEFPKE